MGIAPRASWNCRGERAGRYALQSAEVETALEPTLRSWGAVGVDRRRIRPRGDPHVTAKQTHIQVMEDAISSTTEGMALVMWNTDYLLEIM